MRKPYKDGNDRGVKGMLPLGCLPDNRPNHEQPHKFCADIAYGTGFTEGTYIGMVIREKLSLSQGSVRIISKKKILMH